MIPFDKFGQPIFPSRYVKLQENERVLLSNGFFESKRSPNLFCRNLRQGWIYADMRGTKEVPIWEDTRPLFYWNFDATTPMWERRRTIKVELRRMLKDGCPCRLSFYWYRTDEFVDVSAAIDEQEGLFDWDDGFCRFCKTDFQKEGSFCTEKCKADYQEGLKTPCQVCGQKIELLKEIRHHVSYFPEKVIFVHPACHNKIHKTNEFPGLRPSDEEISTFYRKSNLSSKD
jgi:hypothetical protein